MHMICPSVPISASTELTEFLYISCRKKLPHPSFGAPSLLVPGCIYSLSCLPAATVDELPQPYILVWLAVLSLYYRHNLQDENQFLVSAVVVVPVSKFYFHAVCELNCSNDFRDKQGVLQLMTNRKSHLWNPMVPLWTLCVTHNKGYKPQIWENRSEVNRAKKVKSDVRLPITRTRTPCR